MTREEIENLEWVRYRQHQKGPDGKIYLGDTSTADTPHGRFIIDYKPHAFIIIQDDKYLSVAYSRSAALDVVKTYLLRLNNLLNTT